MKAAHSDMNLSSNPNGMNGNGLNGNGMKSSASAFEILSTSNGNLNEEELELEPEQEERVVEKSANKVSRPRTFK
jgi:hypothetical protein